MSVLEQLIGVVAPSRCCHCEAEGSALCEDCLQLLDMLPASCYRCSKLAYKGICEACLPRTRLSAVYIVTEYRGVAKELVAQCKFGHDRSAARRTGQLLAEHIAPDCDQDCVVVPIPTATSRVRERSFDHAAHIAKQLAKDLNLAYCPALRRIGQKRQVGAKREARIRQVANVYQVKNVSAILDKTVVIVDDVVTTGATIEEASAKLKQAGAKRVVAAVFAKKR